MIFHNYNGIQESLKMRFLFVSIMHLLFILKDMPKANSPALCVRT